MLSNNLKIQKYLKEVNNYLVLNNFKVHAEREIDDEGNITFTYSCEFLGKQSLGIVGLDDKGNFYGLTADLDRFHYLAAEGFTADILEQETERLWKPSTSPVGFVVCMAYPNHEKLKFE
jgi:hypothetical protein